MKYSIIARQKQAENMMQVSLTLVCFAATTETLFSGLSGPCTDHAECKDVRHAQCISRECVCANGYQQYGIVCINVLERPCTADSECTTYLEHSRCDSNCACNTNYTAEDNICKVGLGYSCSVAGDCVTNAVCDTDKLCRCNNTSIANNDICVSSGAGTSETLIRDIIIVLIITVLVVKLF